MKLILLGNNKPLSLLIRTFSFSSWHHVGILVKDSVYEATTKGVVKTPLKEFKKRGRWAIIDVDVPHPEYGINFLENQLGKKYDWSGIWGLLSKDRDWQNEQKWYCTELAAIAFARAGTKLFRDALHGIIPQYFWVLPYPVISMGDK